MIIFILIVYFFSCFKLDCQQLSLAYFNNNNHQLYNPSAWNTDILKYPFIPKNDFSSFYRSQWTGFDLGPKYFGCNYNRIAFNSVLVGIGIIDESFGPLSYSAISGHYAYRLKFKNYSYLSAGGAVSLNFNNYDPTKISIRDLNDPLAEIGYNSVGMSFSPGLFFTTSLKNDVTLSLGLSSENMVNLDFSEIKNIKPVTTLLIHGSIIKFLNYGYVQLSYYEFNLSYRRFKNLSDDFDMSMKYQYKGYLSLKPGFRFGILDRLNFHSLHFDIGIPLSNLFHGKNVGIDINYSSDFPLLKNAVQFGLTHEISFGILF